MSTSIPSNSNYHYGGNQFSGHKEKVEPTDKAVGDSSLNNPENVESAENSSSRKRRSFGLRVTASRPGYNYERGHNTYRGRHTNDGGNQLSGAWADQRAAKQRRERAEKEHAENERIERERVENEQRAERERAERERIQQEQEPQQRANELTQKIATFRAQATAEKWPWDSIEANIDNIKEAHEWEHYVKHQNVPREPRLNALLEARIIRFQQRASAENMIPWAIEYGLEEIKESHQWWHYARQEPREPRLQRLAELGQRLQREYNERAAGIFTRTIGEFKGKAAAEKWPVWAVEHEIERLKEGHEWHYFVQHQKNVPREPRYQALLENKLRLFRAHATAEKWMPRL